jgi:hypothetical protein
MNGGEPPVMNSVTGLKKGSVCTLDGTKEAELRRGRR